MRAIVPAGNHIPVSMSKLIELGTRLGGRSYQPPCYLPSLLGNSDRSFLQLFFPNLEDRFAETVNASVRDEFYSQE